MIRFAQPRVHDDIEHLGIFAKLTPHNMFSQWQSLCIWPHGLLKASKSGSTFPGCMRLLYYIRSDLLYTSVCTLADVLRVHQHRSWWAQKPEDTTEIDTVSFHHYQQRFNQQKLQLEDFWVAMLDSVGKHGQTLFLYKKTIHVHPTYPRVSSSFWQWTWSWWKQLWKPCCILFGRRVMPFETRLSPEILGIWPQNGWDSPRHVDWTGLVISIATWTWHG